MRSFIIVLVFSLFAMWNCIIVLCWGIVLFTCSYKHKMVWVASRCIPILFYCSILSESFTQPYFSKFSCIYSKHRNYRITSLFFHVNFYIEQWFLGFFANFLRVFWISWKFLNGFFKHKTFSWNLIPNLRFNTFSHSFNFSSFVLNC